VLGKFVVCGLLATSVAGCGSDLLDFGFGQNPNYQHGWMPGVSHGTCAKGEAKTLPNTKFGQSYFFEKDIKHCPPKG
jgi:hypothetical protein